MARTFTPLKLARIRSDLLQCDFAERLGISGSKLCLAENGRKSLSAEEMARAAKILKVPIKSITVDES